jgi:hypothetical protein
MRSQEKEVEWNVLDGCFAGLGLLMLEGSGTRARCHSCCAV